MVNFWEGWNYLYLDYTGRYCILFILCTLKLYRVNSAVCKKVTYFYLSPFLKSPCNVSAQPLSKPTLVEVTNDPHTFLILRIT